MIALFLHSSHLRILIVIFVWLFTGAAAVADSLDLSDDLGTPIPQSLQAISIDDADEVRQGLSLARSPSYMLPTLAELIQENLPSFTEFLRLWHTRPLAFLTPLYESLCDYRL
jgi:hypothetical protein